MLAPDEPDAGPYTEPVCRFGENPDVDIVMPLLPGLLRKLDVEAIGVAAMKTSSVHNARHNADATATERCVLMLCDVRTDTKAGRQKRAAGLCWSLSFESEFIARVRPSAVIPTRTRRVGVLYQTSVVGDLEARIK